MRASRHRSMPRTHRRRHRCSYIFIVSVWLFFSGDNFAGRPPLDSFDQFDSGRFLRDWRIAGHRGSSNCRRWTPKRTAEMDGNGGIIAEMMACSTSWCPASPVSGCIVLSLSCSQKKCGDKGATGHGQMEREKGSVHRRRHVSIAPGAAVLPTHSLHLTAAPSFSMVRSK
jgi:hypothetical protein